MQIFMSPHITTELFYSTFFLLYFKGLVIGYDFSPKPLCEFFGVGFGGKGDIPRGPIRYDGALVNVPGLLGIDGPVGDKASCRGGLEFIPELEVKHQAALNAAGSVLFSIGCGDYVLDMGIFGDVHPADDTPFHFSPSVGYSDEGEAKGKNAYERQIILPFHHPFSLRGGLA